MKCYSLAIRIKRTLAPQIINKRGLDTLQLADLVYQTQKLQRSGS